MKWQKHWLKIVFQGVFFQTVVLIYKFVNVQKKNKFVLLSGVCLVEAESSRSSNKITEYSNYKSYGLFQINSKEYCKTGKKGGLCGMKCEDFLKDDIKNDIECAKIIYSRKGFDGWPGWQRKCKGKQLPDISKC